MARFLFYCVNGTGLGHVTRTLAVARQVRKLDGDAEILVLTSSEHAGVLWREGIPSVKVPSYEARERDRRLPVIELAHAISAQTVAIFRPHVMIVDSQAAGMFSELLSCLLAVPRRVFLLSRQPNYFSQPAYKMALQMYNRIVIAYKEEERQTVGVDFGERTVWSGDILVRSAEEMLPRDLARRRLRLSPNATVFYVGLGGGGNPQNDEAVQWILDVLAGVPDILVACAAQPLSRQGDRLFEHDRVIPVSHHPMMEYYAAFDAAVSSAGFNCAELVHAGVPTIWLPLGFPSTDQEFNADRFASKGLGIKVKMFETEALKTAVASLLDAGRRAEMAERMRAWAGPNGAETAARAILELAAEASRTGGR